MGIECFITTKRNCKLSYKAELERVNNLKEIEDLLIDLIVELVDLVGQGIAQYGTRNASVLVFLPYSSAREY